MSSATRLRILRLMGDEEHRHAPLGLEADQQIQHVLAQGRAERAERLVEEQHGAVADQDTRERHTLALAAGQFARQAMLLAGKARPLQRLGDSRPCRRR